jgi:hypothetical protein
VLRLTASGGSLARKVLASLEPGQLEGFLAVADAIEAAATGGDA